MFLFQLQCQEKAKFYSSIIDNFGLDLNILHVLLFLIGMTEEWASISYRQ